MRRARQAMRPVVSGNALAGRLAQRRAGWSQAKVSLLENGRQAATDEDLRDWAAETGADLDELRAAREADLTRQLDIREAARRPGGVVELQGDLENLEAASTTIAEYQPTLVPGLAQTPAYTRTWLTQPERVELGGDIDVEGIVARRSERQRRLAGRDITVAVPPAVLSAVYGSGAAGVATQRAQLDALATSVEGGALELVVVRRPVAILHGFEVLDDLAIVETVAGLHVMSRPDEVAQFQAAMAKMRREGLTGSRALREVAAARDALTER